MLCQAIDSCMHTCTQSTWCLYALAHVVLLQRVVADGGDTDDTADAVGGGERPMDAEPTGEGDGDDDDMNELMHNRDFLHSVLSSLPGVNPEEVLQNVEEIAEQDQPEQGKSEKDSEVSGWNVESQLVFVIE